MAQPGGQVKERKFKPKILSFKLELDIKIAQMLGALPPDHRLW